MTGSPFREVPPPERPDTTEPTPGSFGNAPLAAPPAAQPSPATNNTPPAPTTPGIEPVSIDHCGADNPAGLPASDVERLMGASGGAGFRVLYPYDETVFPRGLTAPLLMWDGANADAVYLHIQASRFEYFGCLRPTAPGQLAMPEDVWEVAGQKTLGSEDPFVLSVALLSGGQVLGPIEQTFTIAKATLKGSIFYNSYSSKLGNNPAAFGGAMFGGFGAGGAGIVLRIPAGGTAEAFASMECNGCHSVSANGSRLLSQTPGGGARAFMLEPDSQPNPPATNAGPRGAYGALTPDGTMYLSTSAKMDVARSSLTGFGAPVAATLYNTDDGSVVQSTGIPEGALMPMFSPDGTQLVFNDQAINNDGRGLALMRFDITSRTASDYKVLYTDSELRPAWPFMLPDNKAVVFARTSSAEFSGEGAGLSGLPTGPRSELHIVDTDSGTVTLLARAMGYHTSEDAARKVTYLPFGAEELDKNYYPTVSPVAAGGYFWVFFDSVRHYGNLGSQRQLWGAAITISADGQYESDLSHPAFYLPGQEFGTGNHRAFAALDPCKKDGDDCTSGVDCCGGFCYLQPGPQELVEPVGSCSSTTMTCAAINERCMVDHDCCPPEPGEPPLLCIAGFCANVTIQ